MLALVCWNYWHNMTSIMLGSYACKKQHPPEFLYHLSKYRNGSFYFINETFYKGDILKGKGDIWIWNGTFELEMGHLNLKWDIWIWNGTFEFERGHLKRGQLNLKGDIWKGDIWKGDILAGKVGHFENGTECPGRTMASRSRLGLAGWD